VAITLYSYWRSTAAYRVRLALNLKGLEYRIVPVSLLPGVSEHRKDAYRQRNPQMLVPYIEDGDFGTGQSQAILEYLEEAYPEPALLPPSTKTRAAAEHENTRSDPVVLQFHLLRCAPAEQPAGAGVPERDSRYKR
jgi:maleylacetoacetate isomerase